MIRPFMHFGSERRLLLTVKNLLIAPGGPVRSSDSSGSAHTPRAKVLRAQEKGHAPGFQGMTARLDDRIVIR
jgi:hypothetical protein